MSHAAMLEDKVTVELDLGDRTSRIYEVDAAGERLGPEGLVVTLNAAPV